MLNTVMTVILHEHGDRRSCCSCLDRLTDAPWYDNPMLFSGTLTESMRGSEIKEQVHGNDNF